MAKEIIYTEIYSEQSKSVDTLFKIYADDKYKARIYFMNENNRIFKKIRLVIFDSPNGDFSIVRFERNYGISKTNIMYNREKQIYSIIKKGNKFYFTYGRKILPLTMSNIYYSTCNDSHIIKNILAGKLPWMRYLTEETILTSTSLNTIYSNKLFSMEKALRYQYKLPLPVAKILHNKGKIDDRAKFIRHYVDYLDNVENLHNTLLTYDFSFFYDTLKMAKIVNKKINCSWSAKRLKAEHDAWAKIITDVIYVDGNRLLTIGDIYLKYATYSGFKILLSTSEMAHEGMVNSHCVASYINKVDSGGCAIYHIDGYTLELVHKYSKSHKKYLEISQFRGYKNCEAPIELVNRVKRSLDVFNNSDELLNSGRFMDSSMPTYNNRAVEVTDDWANNLLF